MDNALESTVLAFCADVSLAKKITPYSPMLVMLTTKENTAIACDGTVPPSDVSHVTLPSPDPPT
ncbi:Uncharacterised protein [uncultured archaeon]|nr:Uncharacterised protein [uncultured archaeon]